jgi:hypothetical protein
MSVRAIISTPTIDRVGDLLVPRGCSLKNYSLNPVVYWGHGLEGIVLPIGKSEDDDGNLTIEVSDDDVYGTCYFAQDYKEAEQIFDLIAQGIIRATSVRETPITQRRVLIKGRTVNQVDSWDMEEWSFAGVGVNPDAVAKCLHTNRLAGKPIAASICKSLNAVATPLKRPGVGFKEANTMDDDENEDKSLLSAEGKGIPSDKPAEELTDNDEDDVPTDEVETSDPDQVPEQDGLYGRKLIGAAHDSMKSMCKSIRDGMKSLDHPALRENMQAFHDDMATPMATLKGMRDEHYPDSSELKEDSEDEDEPTSGDEDQEEGEVGDSAMKSLFSSLKSSAKLTAKGIHSVLTSVSKSRYLPDSERTKLRNAATAMKSLLAQAEQCKPATQTTPATKPKIDEEATKRLRELRS